ncbi:MAG: hypothetical protein Q9214_001608, partial [Letrouitia sp. 1 TL-2023]
ASNGSIDAIWSGWIDFTKKLPICRIVALDAAGPRYLESLNRRKDRDREVD